MKKKLLIFFLTLCLSLLPMAQLVPAGHQKASAVTVVKTYNLTKGISLSSHETVSLSWAYMKKGDRFKTSLTTTGSATVGVASLKSGKLYASTAKYDHDIFYTIKADGYYRVFIYNNCSKKNTCTGVVWHLR